MSPLFTIIACNIVRGSKSLVWLPCLYEIDKSSKSKTRYCPMLNNTYCVAEEKYPVTYFCYMYHLSDNYVKSFCWLVMICYISMSTCHIIMSTMKRWCFVGHIVLMHYLYKKNLLSYSWTYTIDQTNQVNLHKWWGRNGLPWGRCLNLCYDITVLLS